jgi:hypothetical protein
MLGAADTGDLENTVSEGRRHELLLMHEPQARGGVGGGVARSREQLVHPPTETFGHEISARVSKTWSIRWFKMSRPLVNHDEASSM